MLGLTGMLLPGVLLLFDPLLPELAGQTGVAGQTAEAGQLGAAGQLTAVLLVALLPPEVPLPPPQAESSAILATSIATLSVVPRVSIGLCQETRRDALLQIVDSAIFANFMDMLQKTSRSMVPEGVLRIPWEVSAALG
ncbi:MAG: hypothetical protein RXR20_19190 [Paraburkholderia sp.]